VTRQRATVRLLLECSNACIFCAQTGLPSKERDVSLALKEARTNADEVTFVGGEPTLDPALEERIAEARTLGFRRVGIQTNGRKLAVRSYASSLARAGLTDVHLSIHGADPAVHDYHTGVDGSLAASLAGLAASRAHHLEVVVATVVTRSNFRNLGSIPRMLGERGVAGWLLEIPRIAGRAAEGFDRVIPRLALALPFALHALEAARALGVPAWIRGAPLCVLGPFATRALEEPTRDYGTTCEECPARASCTGVESDYLARFGEDELSKREPPQASDDAAALRAMFVGVGELARVERAIEPSVGRARASLPILGKVRPARAEASPATDRKTGEALREILPDLFEPRE